MKFPKFTIEERFWSKVDKSGGPNTCWPWTAGKCTGGYGSFRLSSTHGDRAHRVAYMLSIGPIPNGKIVCHSCDNPPCCNPKHFWIGTNADNVADRVSKGRSSGGRASGSANGAHRHPECFRGTRNGQAKLTEADVIAIRIAGNKGQIQRRIAEQFKVSPALICMILQRRLWSHLL